MVFTIARFYSRCSALCFVFLYKKFKIKVIPYRKLFCFLLNNTPSGNSHHNHEKKKNSSTKRDLYTQQKKEYLSVFPLVCPVYTWKALSGFFEKSLLAFLCLSCRILIEKTDTIHLLTQYVLHNGLGRNHTDAVCMSLLLYSIRTSQVFS